MNTNLNTDVYNADIYLRLSREDGDKEESDSITNQKELILEFLKSRKDIRVHAIRADDGYSGVNFDRPAFQQMLEDIKNGKVNCVITKDLSRFGRNHIEVGKYIEKIFPYLGVRFIAINDRYDSIENDAQANNIIIPFKNLINDAYCRDISIKTVPFCIVRMPSHVFLRSVLSSAGFLTRLLAESTSMRERKSRIYCAI